MSEVLAEKKMRGVPAGRKIEGLDSLRGIAILQIMLFHFGGKIFKGGYIGVCMFLALGGYLLMIKGIAACERESFRLGEYFFKRVARIYPEMLIMLAGVSVVAAFMIPGSVLKLGQELLSSVFGVNNWWRIGESQSYFSSAAETDPFSHLWYLSLQIQLYLIFPLVLMAYLAARKHSRRMARMVLGGISAISMLFMPIRYLTGGQNALTSVYYATDSRAFSFLAGCFLAVWIQDRRKDGRVCIDRTFPRGPVILGLFVMQTLLSFTLSGSYGFTYFGGMQLVTINDLLLIVLIQEGEGKAGAFMDRTPLKWIGDYSYELYLIHYPIMVLIKSRMHGKIAGSSILFTAVYIVFIFFFAILLKKAAAFVGKGDIMKNFKKNVIAAGLIASAMILSSCAVINSRAYKDHNAMVTGLNRNSEYFSGQNGNGGLQGADGVSGYSTVTEEQGSDGVSEDETQTSDGTAVGSADDRHILAVGDSVMLGAAPSLQDAFANIKVDAEEGRQEYNAIDEVAKLLNQNPDVDTVILGLGTNGYFYQEDGQKMIDEIGSDKDIYWVNTYNRDQQDTQKQINDVISALADANSNVHLISWDEEAPNHPDWFWDDGIHLNPQGQEGYAEFIKECIGGEQS
ncbi:MAG: acyltransferase family protein [Bilifractor sp.]|nr:acetyltransferase [Lachnospiraceae bacterium]MDY2838393.1 acyltransferase family protein [Bilifractor sp.]